MIMRSFKILFSILIALSFSARGQEKESEIDTLLIDSKRFNWHPIVGSGPETGFLVGIGFLHVVKEADSTTRASFLNGNLAFTFKGYWMVNTSWRYFSHNERYFIQSDVSYSNTPLYFYGIGNDIDPERKELYFSKSLRVQGIAFKRIAGQLFIGFGYQAGSIYAVQAPENGILRSANVYGYNGHTLSGPIAAILYDSRDNQLSSTKGLFVRLSNGTSIKELGSSFDFNSITLDARVFVKPIKHKQNVIAAQFLGISASGEVPFTELALLGSQSIMRGYYSGRYRDKKMMAMQIEYRHHITDWLGVVGFAGAGSVMPQLSQLGDNILPTYGGGLRFRLSSVHNLNLRVDYGMGKESRSFYIGLMEAF